MTRPTFAARATGAGAIAAGSQILGVLQLFLLLGNGVGVESDAYFYVLAWVTAPIQLVLVSTLFPMMLRRGGVAPATLLTCGLLTTTLTIVLVAVGTAVFARTFTDTDGLARQSVLLTISTVVSIPAWIHALGLSAAGSPAWLSGINLLPSVIALPSLAVVYSHDLGTRVAVLLVAQAVGFGFYGVLAHRALRRERREHPSSGAVAGSDGRAWFLAQGGSAYVSILAIQTAATALPTSSLTILGVIARVVSAGTGLVSNSILPLLVNTERHSRRGISRYAQAVILLAPAPIVLLMVGSAYLPGGAPSWIFSVPVWFAVILVNAALHRLAFLVASPRLSLVTIVVSPAVAVVAWILVPDHPMLSTILGCFIALEMVSALPYALALRLRRTAWLLLVLGATYGGWLVFGL